MAVTYKLSWTLLLGGSLVLAATLLPETSYAQKMSRASESFLLDMKTVAGTSKIGRELFEADPNKRKWGDYCTGSQNHARAGNFRMAVQEAAKALYLAQKESSSYGAAHVYAYNDIAMAYSYAGDTETASIYATRTLEAARKGYEQWAHDTVLLIRANAHRIVALNLSQNGQHAQAIKELERGIDVLPRFAARYAHSELHLSMSNIQLRAGQLDDAKSSAQKVMKESEAWFRLSALRALGEITLAEKNTAQAKSYLEQALTIATEIKAIQPLAYTHLALARTARMEGKSEVAQEHLSKSLSAIEGIRQSFSSSEMRSALYGNLQNVFDEAVDFFFEQKEYAKAFAASESARARAMLDLQRKVDQNTTRVLPLGLAQIQAKLSANEAMLVYHQLPSSLLVWTVTRNNLSAQRLALTAQDTQAQVQAMRRAIEAEGSQAMTLGQALYQKLMPDMTALAKFDIAFVPHKSLHLLPFQALHDGKEWLIQKHAIGTALSASLYTKGAGLGAGNQLIALGNPELGKVEWALPGAESEVKAIAPLYSRANVVVQKEASKQYFVEQSQAGADILHVAAHAMMDELDPMHAVIKLAIGVPIGADKDKPWSSDLEARELGALKLQNVKLITLSACNSGVGKVAQGDEFMGFKRAIFSAGASSALVSLWPVDDESTKELMVTFHQRWSKDKDNKRTAMQAAQLKVLGDPKFAHPYFWAPFTLVGDPS